MRDLFAVDDAGAQALDPGVRGLDDRTTTQQAQRDAYTRGWRYLYTGVGLVVTFVMIGLVGAGAVNGVWILVIPAYWAGGQLLSRFVLATVIDPWLDDRYPMSRSQHVTR